MAPRHVHGESSFTQIQNCGGVKKRLGVFVYVCAHGIATTTVQTLFAKSSTNVWHIFNQCLKVFKELEDDFIRLPASPAEWVRISRKFERSSGFPDACCAFDGTHVLINRPNNWNGFYNRKGLTSLAIQGVVDADMLFMNVSIRPGSVNDKRSLSGSTFGQHLAQSIPFGATFWVLLVAGSLFCA
jgi:hypothetical protein